MMEVRTVMCLSIFMGWIHLNEHADGVRETSLNLFTFKCGLPPLRNYTLPWIHPGKVGKTSYIAIQDGPNLRRITRALDPPVFEIPDFLSADECAYIIQYAKKRGLRGAKQMGNQSVRASGRPTGRVAQTTFISHGRHLQTILERTSAVTGVPLDLVVEAEPIQVVMYREGGYYHSHFDSTWKEASKPCCHHTWFPHTRHRCAMCRYMTVLLYLNDVDEGGHTAFPLADQTQVSITRHHTNLTENCQDSTLIVQPQMGKAIVWFNHHRDPQTGWLGSLNLRSLHGGCNVISGGKWIANLWINAAPYADKDKHSIYTVLWD